MSNIIDAKQYTIPEAAKLKGTPSDRQIRRHIKEKKLKSEKDSTGKHLIYGRELANVYKLEIDSNMDDGIARKPERHRNDIAMPMTKNSGVIPENHPRIIELNKEIQKKDEQITELKADKIDAIAQRDAWQKQAQTLLLTDQSKPNSKQGRTYWPAVSAAIIVAVALTGLILVKERPQLLASMMPDNAQPVTGHDLPPKETAAIPATSLSDIEPAAGPTVPETEEAPSLPQTAPTDTPINALGSPYNEERAIKGDSPDLKETPSNVLKNAPMPEIENAP